MIDEAYAQAIKVLRDCVSDIGFKASALDDGYHEVWGRDSMITLLGAILTKEQDLIQAAQTSLNTLAKYQTELGLIPNNVDVQNNEPEYRAYMDGTSWYIIGCYNYFRHTNDREFLKSHSAPIKRALTWLNYQDVDNSGLISTQEAGDWMDLFPVRGKVLYDNALYVGALRAGAELAKISGDEESVLIYEKRQNLLKQKIHSNLWMREVYTLLREEIDRIHSETKNNRQLEEDVIKLGLNSLRQAIRPYFLAFKSFREYGDWFDTLGNSLAVLFEIADARQTEMIFDYAFGVGVAEPYPAKAIHPVIDPGHREWHEYFRAGNLNIPHQYHNGGIWPFVGGFYIAALVKAGRILEAQRALDSLAKANYQGKTTEWEFNEWLHGQTGRPMGKEKQAWSAGMYIFAYNCVKNKRCEVI
jgi:glycogen debranching enzyme